MPNTKAATINTIIFDFSVNIFNHLLIKILTLFPFFRRRRGCEKGL
jgi:hypothetical protein